MKAYFQIQLRMSNRKMTEFGFPLLLGYILILVGFIGLSNYIFSKTEFAPYFYGLFAISFVVKLSEFRRNNFLKSVFSHSNYLQIRMIENMICILPFTLFLVYKKSFVFSLALLSLAILKVFINFRSNLNVTIPTPFNKKPFEFTVGFRKTFPLFPIAYFLMFMAVYVGNFNLGIFSMILVGLVCLSFYSKPEKEYYVWNFSYSPKEFLIEKVKIGVKYFTFLSLPILITLAVFFTDELHVLLIFFVLCYIYLVVIIFAKYSSYPDEMELLQGILIAVSLLFPLTLVGILPFFYTQSIKRLNSILE